MDVHELLEGSDARALLEDAEVAHLAIETGRGPHVTPELFCWNAGRLWFATARRTLKARKTRSGMRVGALIEHGPHALTIVAEARPLDVVRPETLLAAPTEVALAPAAGLAFLLRNAPHLAGFAVQGPWAWPHSLSTLRMFVALQPVAAALLFHDEIRATAGIWASEAVSSRTARRPRQVESPELPDDLAPLAEAFAADAVVGLGSPAGPVALPATWDGERSEATVGRSLLSLAGVPPEGPAAIEVDRMTGYAMNGKRGVLLRGDARITHGGRFSTVGIDPERATFWRGMDTETVPATQS